MVGLTYDKCCLIHNLCVEEKWGSEKKLRKRFQINEHF